MLPAPSLTRFRDSYIMFCSRLLSHQLLRSLTILSVFETWPIGVALHSHQLCVHDSHFPSALQVSLVGTTLHLMQTIYHKYINSLASKLLTWPRSPENQPEHAKLSVGVLELQALRRLLPSYAEHLKSVPRDCQIDGTDGFAATSAYPLP